MSIQSSFYNILLNVQKLGLINSSIWQTW